jgi:flagellar hook-associated protein 3 FlgL
MKPVSISTLGLSNATRLAIMRMQVELAKGEKELVTGRHADIGLALGAETARSVSLRQDHARLEAIIASNGLVAARLETTQGALDGIRQTAEAFALGFLGVGAATTDRGIVRDQAVAGLTSMIGTLNTAVDGEYLFAGINTDVKPVADYFAPASAAAQSVDAAFQAAFGVTADDPTVAQISAADMQAFLDGAFADLFGGAAWADWSSAADRAVRSRISTTELTETGTTANQPAMQKLAMAYTMVVDLGGENFNEAAYQTLMTTASKAIGEAIGELITTQARLASVQSRVADANDRMSVQTDIIAKHINGIEGVDPFEASTRVSELLTQIETAYALTARIQQLSLLKHI